MSIIEHAKAELTAINFGEEDTAVMIGLLEKFLGQWDSGGAVHAVAPVFVRLLNGQPLASLTGADDEWFDPLGDGVMLQNKRCSSVFKDWRDAEGRLSETAGTGSRVIRDIANLRWDGCFPYDPTTRLPPSPVMEIG